VVELGFPATPTKEIAMDCVGVGVRAKSGHANGLILAIDLGKYKSVLRVHEPSEPSWQTASLATSQALLQVLDKYRPGVVVIEVCGPPCRRRVTSRLDALCTPVTLDSRTVTRRAGRTRHCNIWMVGPTQS
jgi:hypothetical protein